MLIHQVVDIVLLSLGSAVCALYDSTDKLTRGNLRAMHSFQTSYELVDEQLARRIDLFPSNLGHFSLLDHPRVSKRADRPSIIAIVYDH